MLSQSWVSHLGHLCQGMPYSFIFLFIYLKTNFHFLYQSDISRVINFTFMEFIDSFILLLLHKSAIIHCSFQILWFSVVWKTTGTALVLKKTRITSCNIYNWKFNTVFLTFLSPVVILTFNWNKEREITSTMSELVHITIRKCSKVYYSMSFPKQTMLIL